MHVSTQVIPSSSISVMKEQFLIVPIFFKNQIESLVKANEPDAIFGFFYGEQRENYRIIKKLWPVPHSEKNNKEVSITTKDFDQAKSLETSDTMRLLGCFYTAKNGAVRKAILSNKNIDSFSFVELSESDNETCIWSSIICATENSRSLIEKVIL